MVLLILLKLAAIALLFRPATSRRQKRCILITATLHVGRAAMLVPQAAVGTACTPMPQGLSGFASALLLCATCTSLGRKRALSCNHVLPSTPGSVDVKVARKDKRGETVGTCATRCVRSLSDCSRVISRWTLWICCIIESRTFAI